MSKKWTLPEKNEFKTARGPIKTQEDKIQFIYTGNTYYDQAYVGLHPKSISIAANDPKGGYDVGVNVGQATGTIIHGPVSMYTDLNNIRIGPKSMINPAHEAYVPSTLDAPIPVLAPKQPWQIATDVLVKAVNEAISVLGPIADRSIIGYFTIFDGTTDNPDRIAGSSSAQMAASAGAGAIGGAVKGRVKPMDIVGGQSTAAYKSKEFPPKPDCAKQFMDKLNQVAANLGVNPRWLYNLFDKECGLNPQVQNKNTNAVGLIQFLPRTLDSPNSKIGISWNEMKGLNGTQQLDYVETYLRGSMPYNSAADLYCAVFMTVAKKLPDNTVIGERGNQNKGFTSSSLDTIYKQNEGLDVDKDGKITKSDLGRRLDYEPRPLPSHFSRNC